ncbi:MAG: ATP-dependent Clp protease ATP-binding subunit ClpA, partial [Proteobacteria bacterium]|nr:ATP-dependent Clp protease ATP-binding subunit ClpA [Pseudomonadota bacterium]
RQWLARKGFDKVFGARPLGRVIQEHVKRPLADELLFGRLAKGGVVKVTVKDGALDFDITEAPKKATKKAPKSAKPKRPKEPALVE